MAHHGSCLCGAVTVEADLMPSLQACHCGMCRKWGGGPMMAIPSGRADFIGPVSRYASSAGISRGFCTACGSHLFFNLERKGVWAIPAGLFDDVSDIPFRAEIYVDDQPDWYAFDGTRKRMTGAEFKALMHG